MKVEVLPATLTDKQIVANLMQLYLYEFPYIDHLEIGEDGRFTYHYFERYWSEPGRYPFLIRVDGRLTGFALVMKHELMKPGWPGHAIAEFFVLRKHRRRRVGERAARALFDTFPGPWWVAEHVENRPAQAFWRTVIDRYTDGKYQERVWHGDDENAIVQTFDNSPQG